MTLFYCTTDQVRVLSICVEFLLELCPFWNVEYWKYTVFHTFLLCALTYWDEILHFTLLTTDQVKSVVSFRQFLYARLQTGRIMVWWCPSDSPSVRVSDRPFSALFSYMLWHIELKFCTWLCFTVLQIKFECRHFASSFKELWLFVNLEYRLCAVFRTFLLHALTYWAEILHMTLFHRITDQVRVSSIYINFCGSYAPFGTSNTGNTQFSALFSYMLWHIELKVCIWLCFTVLQIKFECCEFVSMVVGVTPLLELRILKIHSFPHFSLTCFDILSWNFAYDFVSPYYRSSLNVVNLHRFLWELCPFWNLEYWKYNVQFSALFSYMLLTYWAEILHKTLFHRITDQVRV